MFLILHIKMKIKISKKGLIKGSYNNTLNETCFTRDYNTFTHHLKGKIIGSNFINGSDKQTQ